MKRFTDTEIWDKEWFMVLSCKHKCLVRYLFDKCDAAGMWSPNWTLASAHVGECCNSGDLNGFADRLEFVGKKIFIPDFIEFQYGELTEKCPPHRKIIALLRKYSLLERVTKGYRKGSNTPQEEEEDKEEEKETEGEKDKGDAGENPEQPAYGDERLLVPQMLQRWKQSIQTYPDDPQLDGKALYSIAAFLCKRGNLRGAPSENAEAVLDAWEQLCAFIAEDRFYKQKSLKTISNCIQEILQKALNGDQSKPAETKRNGKILDPEKLKAGLRDRFARRQQGTG